MAKVTGIAHTGFTVMDMDKTLDFWVDILGGIKTGESVIEGENLGHGVFGAHAAPYAKMRMATVSLGGYEIEFFQYLTPATAPYHGDPSVAGSAHAAFEVDDLHQFYDELKKKGVLYHSPVNQNMENGIVTMYWVYLRDPNNICIELIQPAD